jgi:hypothetical protein
MKVLARHSAWILLGLTILFVVFVRVRLREMPLERDEGEYAYAGQLMLHGVPPYKEAYNMKLPGTYGAYAAIMAVFGQTPSGIHLGVMLVNAASIFLIFLLGRKLLDDVAGVVAAVSFALLSLSPSVLGLAGHATHFVVLPALAGMLLLVEGLGLRVESRRGGRKERRTLNAQLSTSNVEPREMEEGERVSSGGACLPAGAKETVETVSSRSSSTPTSLKRGVNEKCGTQARSVETSGSQPSPLASQPSSDSQPSTINHQLSSSSCGSQLSTLNSQLFLSGLLFGLAFLMKQHGVFFGIFGGVYLFWIWLRPRFETGEEKLERRGRRPKPSERKTALLLAKALGARMPRPAVRAAAYPPRLNAIQMEKLQREKAESERREEESRKQKAESRNPESEERTSSAGPGQARCGVEGLEGGGQRAESREQRAESRGRG